LVSVIKKPISGAGVVVKTHTTHVKSTAQLVGLEDLLRSELTVGRTRNLMV
jgi:hypothetical protein